ncbi:hypothetical protein [Egbenema bharatensis]|uniref:hypothetical protein n=1 Tax=Egbenema bharatensis TaxID=3463334 RepID=UPI000D07FE18|nr:hypothetical protein C7B76_09165 [filamentous cyanobacterium CCP2]
MENQELKNLIKETMREVLREERLILCKILMPYVDDAEQAELEAEFGSPTDYDEDEEHPLASTMDVIGDLIANHGADHIPELGGN